VKRYLTDKPISPRMVWRVNHKVRWIPTGKKVRLEPLAPAVIHWSADDWKTVHDVTSHEVGLGIHPSDLSTQALPEGKQVRFTFHRRDADRWEGKNFVVRVGAL
jgi:glucoamylase